MKHTVAFLLGGLLAGFLGAGCSSRVCCAPARSIEPARTFFVLRATPLVDPDGGPAQIFIEGRVVTVPVALEIAALNQAKRLEVETAPVWLAGTQVPDAAFGAKARVVSGPSLLAIDGQDATVYVGEDNGDGSMVSGWLLEITPTVEAEHVHLSITYRRHEAGRLAEAIPATSVDVPAGRVLIIESLPAR